MPAAGSENPGGGRAAFTGATGAVETVAGGARRPRQAFTRAQAAWGLPSGRVDAGLRGPVAAVGAQGRSPSLCVPGQKGRGRPRGRISRGRANRAWRGAGGTSRGGGGSGSLCPPPPVRLVCRGGIVVTPTVRSPEGPARKARVSYTSGPFGSLFRASPLALCLFPSARHYLGPSPGESRPPRPAAPAGDVICDSVPPPGSQTVGCHGFICY